MRSLFSRFWISTTPRLRALCTEQQVDEDTTASYRFKAFTDEEEDKASRSLVYTALWAEKDSAGNDKVDANGKKTFVYLPTWIVFDGLKRRFTFEADKSWHAGRHTLRVVGTDEGIPDAPAAKSAFAEFVLEVLDFNDAPVASTLVDQKVAEDTTASYRFDAFTDEEEGKVSRSLLYTALWAEKDSAGNDKVDADGKQTFVSLPRWIVFDGLKRRFTFDPDKSWHAGRHTLRVVGTEKGISGKPTPKSAIAEFVLDVEEVNDAPVASSLTEQKVREDVDEAHASATYLVPKFTDEEDDAAGVPLKYRAFWASKDGDGEDVVDGAGEKVLVDLPEWIPFDPETRTFTFRPDEDSHAGGAYASSCRGRRRDCGDEEAFACGFRVAGGVRERRTCCEPSEGAESCGGFVCELPFRGLYGRGNAFVGSCIQRPFACFSLAVCRGGFVRGLSCVGADFFRFGGVRFGRDVFLPRTRRSLFRTGYRSMEVSVCFVFRPRRVRMWADMRCVFVGATRAGRRRRRILRCTYLPRTTLRRRMFR